jgi:hypothetical protein
MTKKKSPNLTPQEDPARPNNNWPALLDATYHPDIANALHQIPFTPPVITHNSTTEEELEANQEAIFAAGCQLYEMLRRPHQQVSSVYQLINATRSFLSLRRKFLNLETNDSQSSAPIRPKVFSIG